MSILASNLKLLREEASISIEELSEKTGINVQLLKAFEEDQITPNDYQIEVLCRILKMPSDDIATRDLVEERKNATKRMRSKETREQYNWYFGNKKRFIFYLCYLGYFVIATSLLIWYVASTIINREITWEILRESYYYYNYSYPFFIYLILVFWQLFKYVLIIYSLGASFFILFDFFWGRRIIIRWWYIFWISIMFTLVVLLGIFGAFPYFVYTIIRLIRGKY